MNGRGHPLPGSDEARHNEIPEHLGREKGRGDDPRPLNQPERDPVDPDGEPYRYGDLGRGPGPAISNEEIARDQAAHQERGQATAEEESDRD